MNERSQKKFIWSTGAFCRGYFITVYSGYSGHVYSGHSDIVATFPGTKYIYSIIFRSDIVANRIEWPERSGPRWPLYPKCIVFTSYYVRIRFKWN